MHFSPKRLAVVFHDPHWSRLGRFQMMEALRVLIPEPNKQPAVFLVEGNYWGQSREINLAPWDVSIGRGPQHDHEIRQLVYDYAIDAVLGARLLRAKSEIKSYAIDDQRLLNKSPRMPDPEKLLEAINNLNMPDEERDVWTGLILGTSTLSDPPKFETLLSAIEQEVAIAVGERKNVLARVQSYVEVYQIAALRNNTMVAQINARMREHADAIPYIFIGSFHTDAMLAALRKSQPQTQFVVLDLRGSHEDHGDHEAFQDAIGRSSDTDKGFVLPRPEDRDTIERRVLQIRDKVKKDFLDADLDPQYRDAVSSRPGFQGIRVRVAQSGNPPPPPPPAYKTAFASFEPDSVRLGGEVHIYDPSSVGLLFARVQ